jgi:hypothetical protein
MDVVSALTVKNLTPPGYFNLSPAALQSTNDYVTWWDNILSKRANDSVNLKQLLLTPWLYNHPDSPRTPYLQYLTTLYGMGFFGGTNNQAAYLYRLLSSAWSLSTIYNISMILQTFSLPPFSWFTMTAGGITAGNLVSSLMDTGFLIYSTASSPSTPSPTAYLPRAWTVPVGWTQAASSAVKYSRGYKSGSTIIWCAPRPVSDFNNAYVFSVNIPVAIPSVGTIAIVNDDGTGDISSVYYCDGTAWRKNSTPNADLGLVNPTGGRPSPEAITVWAPNPTTVPYAIDSQVPPPVSGATQGYGTFATWANNLIFTDEITITVVQIAGGTVALATLTELLRRIKPLNKTFTLIISGIQYTITDVRQK